MKDTPAGGLLEEPVTTRSQEAHHRAHLFYRTECAGSCELELKWAARRLITPRQFLTAARAAPGLEAMADELDVLTRDVCSYMADLSPDEWLIMVRLTGLTGACKGVEPWP